MSRPVRTYADAPRTGTGAANAREMIRAMSEGYGVSFVYGDKHRDVEVHAVGRSRTGGLLMRGFQTGGQASRPLPQWTLFDLGKVEQLDINTFPSAAPREGYAQGDKQMHVILAELALG